MCARADSPKLGKLSKRKRDTKPPMGAIVTAGAGRAVPAGNPQVCVPPGLADRTLFTCIKRCRKIGEKGQ